MRISRIAPLAAAAALAACSVSDRVTGNQTSAGTGPGAGTLVTVHITDSGFSPSGITVQRGTVVRFVNDTNVPHSVSPENPGQPGAWTGSGLSQQGQQIDIVFNTAGDFGYFCAPHVNTERGLVRVQ